jgi:hypothetical protein
MPAMSLAAVMGRTIVALSLALFLGGCPETMLQQPPTCGGDASMSPSIQLIPTSGGQNIFGTNPPVVDPNVTYSYLMSVTAQSTPPSGPPIGIKTISVIVYGITDCTGPQGTQRVSTYAPLYSVDYPPYGSTIGGLVQTFNYSQIACPAGTVATAGTLFFNDYIGTYCEHVWFGDACASRVIAGRQVGVKDPRCNGGPGFSNIAAAD